MSYPPTHSLVAKAIDLAEEFYASGDKAKIEEADKIMDAVASALEAEFVMLIHHRPQPRPFS
jgi:hypothetical protein